MYYKFCNNVNTSSQYLEDITNTTGKLLDNQQFLPNSCLIVTWDKVGYYSAKTDLVSCSWTLNTVSGLYYVYAIAYILYDMMNI